MTLQCDLCRIEDPRGLVTEGLAHWCGGTWRRVGATCALCGELLPDGEEMFRYHGHSGPCPTPSARKGSDQGDLRAWMASVAAAWDEHWRGTDHRYGRDFAAFVGERLLTDFDLRDFARNTPA